MNRPKSSKKITALLLSIPIVPAIAMAAWATSSDTGGPAASSDGQVHQALVADGQSPEIADCVVRLGGDQIDQAGFDELVQAELISACEAAQIGLDAGGDDGANDGELAFVDDDQPHDYGDDRELDQLWDDCKQGSGQACDELFAQSPYNSSYEEFGLTCGQRDDILHCLDLDEVDEGPIPEVYVRDQN